MELLTGEKIRHFEIVERINGDDMAAVYKAVDESGSPLAIKVLFPTLKLTDNALQSFSSEAKVLTGLQHPNIIRMIDYGGYKSSPFIVMPYLPGGTIKEKITGPISWRTAVKTIKPVAEAVAYAHSKDVIHRGIKPTNILLTESGVPILSDFGIMNRSAGETALNQVANRIPYYFALEYLFDGVVFQSDIYGLGIVLYEMVTGCRPFIGEKSDDNQYKPFIEPLDSPRSIIPDLPEGVEYVICKALAEVTENRHQTAQEFISDLEDLLQDEAGHEGNFSNVVQSVSVLATINQKAEKQLDENWKPEIPEHSDSGIASKTSEQQPLVIAAEQEAPEKPEQIVPITASQTPAKLKKENIVKQDIPEKPEPGVLSTADNQSEEKPTGFIAEQEKPEKPEPGVLRTADNQPEEKATGFIDEQKKPEKLKQDVPISAGKSQEEKGSSVIMKQEITEKPEQIVPSKQVFKIGRSTRLVMMRIPAGEFIMGSGEKEFGLVDPDEQPEHMVHLSEFHISKYPITHEQYAVFLSSKRYPFPSHWRTGQIPLNSEKYPIVNVSWVDAMAFCEWLSRELKCLFRLPTEAEWEKAARGLNARRYPWGDQWNTRFLNSEETRLGRTSPVDQFSPEGDSVYGVSDMLGNVWEWCLDWYDPDYYTKCADRQVANPQGPRKGTQKSLRGGSYMGGRRIARCACRYRDVREVISHLYGFRIAMIRGPKS
jgi:formylglycine-generating enzyme required for sulfatase activity